MTLKHIKWTHPVKDAVKVYRTEFRTMTDPVKEILYSKNIATVFIKN